MIQEIKHRIIKKIMRQIKDEFWENKKLIVIWITKDTQWNYILPKYKQPVFHIDVFFTPLPDGSMVIWTGVKLDFEKIVKKQLEQLWKTVYIIPQWKYGKQFSFSYLNVRIETKNWKTTVFVPQYFTYKTDIKYKLEQPDDMNKSALEQRKGIPGIDQIIPIPINMLSAKFGWSLNCKTGL